MGLVICSHAELPQAHVTLQSAIKANLLMIKPSISLLLSSEIILKQLFASGSVNIGKYLVNIHQYLLCLCAALPTEL